LECPTRLIEPKISNLFWYAFKAFNFALIILLISSYFINNYYLAFAEYYYDKFELKLFAEMIKKSD
jgi:hypothetical protein